jgi:hypothetical protein
MRPLSKAALGGGIVSVATVGGLVVGGVFATTATLIVTDPLAPRANADSLSRFDSCGALLRWYVDHAVKEVGPYGWNSGRYYPMFASEDAVAPQAVAGSAATDSAKSSATAERSSSRTGTNTQEADVDEPDVAKTDGHRVVRLVDQRTLVISDVTGDEPRELGRISLPMDAYGGELLLVGDHVLVTQAGGVWREPMPVEGGMAVDDLAVGKAVPYGGGGGTRVIDIDISDAAHPRIVHDDTYSGSEVSVRLYGDVVRVVTSTPRPELSWKMPGQPGHGKLTEREATRRNQALVRASTIEDWLPSVRDNLSGAKAMHPLLDCTDVYHPAEWSGGDTTAVTTYGVRDPGDRQTVGVTADGQVVYSSNDRLYVAATRYDQPSVWRRMGGAVMDREIMPRPQDVQTQLHAFALDGTATRYVGSGHLTGTVRDRWSMDEHDGKLRVAWTRDQVGRITDSNGESRQHTRNGITIFAERDGGLVPTGTIGDLGIDENIQSVRWFDDLAVLVTFRQMDPLYTIDLSDQDHPREIGALKIPGFSGYLHPIGDDLLLGLGINATNLGRNLGGQAAVFDIGDLHDPRRISTQGFGEQSSLPALDDPRGFTWLPDGRTGLTTVATWTSDRTRLVALHVTPSGALEARDLATDVGWNARTLPLEDGRVALVDEKQLRILEVR